MPVSKYLPYAWYETPNIHFCTVTDFENLCQQQGIKILNRTVVGQKERQGWIAQAWPNLLGVTAIYHISK
jgi:methionine biosynthesis protein MetW